MAIRTEKKIFEHYNVQVTANYIYGMLREHWLPGPGRITTVGASNTWTAVTGTPFANVVVGDRIVARGRIPSNTFSRTVTAKASGASITVDGTAVDLGVLQADGFAFSFRSYDPVPAAGAEVGWFSPGGGTHSAIINVSALGATSIEYSIETRFGGGPPIQLSTGSITSATFPDQEAVVAIAHPVEQLRIGVKMTGAGTNSVDVSLVSDQNPA